MKEASDKLVQAEKQILAAEAETKKLLIASEEASEKQLQAEKKLQAAESEMKRLNLLLADKEASDQSLKLKSIVKSKKIIGTDSVKNVKGTVKFPKMQTLTKKSAQELRNLAITKV